MLNLVGGSCAANPEHISRSLRHRRGLARCESPAERRFVHAIAQTADFRWRLPDEHPWEVGRWPSLRLVLLSQATMQPYRADFAIVPTRWSPRQAPPIVVEIDGHYHNLKHRAEHDRVRDRYMSSIGTTVLRFGGAEIWRDASGCADEALAIALQRLSAR
jgi:very-short-patch-repair endonuclease